jgi:fructose-specific PTS system IIA-like component
LAVEFDFLFALPQGLHARPAGRFQETAERFEAEVRWINLRTGAEADGKSSLALIGTDTQPGDPCRIRIDGPAAPEARRALRALLEDLPRWEAEAAEAQAAPSPDLPRILALEKALVFRGQAAGPGIVRGPAAIRGAAPDLIETSGPAKTPQEEKDDFRRAAAALAGEIQTALAAKKDRTERGVLEAHLSILRDRAFAAKVEDIIAAGNTSAAAAVARAGRLFSAPLQASRSAYIRERIADIRDIGSRLMAHLGGPAEAEDDVAPTEPSILIADDLPPSRFLALERRLLLGLVLENAGMTSHTLIMSRARGIPAVVGCPGLRGKLRRGEDIILDGGRGLVIPAPSEAVGRYYEREAAWDRRRAALRREKGRLPGLTADGRRVEIAANIGDPEELAWAWDNGAEGVGLFRTELMLMGRPSAPGEEEQFGAYARLAREAGGRPIIVRTFDIGGDKPLPFLPLPVEANPFLGCRGVRIYERHGDLIRTQLRALLRAAALGPLKIMVPMIATLDEILGIKVLVAGVAGELAAAGLPHRSDVELGMMVEVPSAALLVDRFAEHVDFFSVGSNDLLQYFFAADRGNPDVRSIGRPEHPAFLRLLRTIVDAAHEKGRWVGLCGEMAASVRLLPLLVGLGFDELSMNAAAIPGIKARLGALDAAACRVLTLEAAGLDRAAAVGGSLDAFGRPGAGAPLIVPELVRLRSDSRSKAEALQELAALLEEAGRTEDRREVEKAFWQRESTGSTGLGFGVSIPHGKTAAVGAVCVGMMRFAAPFLWDTNDEEPVDLAFMLVIPDGERSQEPLRLLARLSRRIVHDDFRAALRAATDEEMVVRLVEDALAG